jgi:hypothetical protein
MTRELCFTRIVAMNQKVALSSDLLELAAMFAETLYVEPSFHIIA